MRPSVLLVLFDDLRTNSSALPLHMPRLAALGREGTTYALAVANYPVCAPSRTMLLTGRFLQVAPESPQEAENAKRLATKTLLRYFQNNGYATYAAGKVFDGLLEGAWTASLKFDARRTKCQDSRSERRNEPRCAPVIDTVDAAPARWLRERIRWHDVKKKPFLAAFGLRRPHAPWEYAAEHYEDKSLPPSPTFPADAPLVSWSDNWGRVAKRSGNKGRCPTPKGGLPPPLLAQRFRGAYAASCQTADTYLGRVLDACDARTDNLVVAVTSDHGMHLGDHGIWSKQTLFDYSLRVPLILRGPGVPIRVVDTPVETARLFSTLSFLAGLEVPPGVEPVLPPFGPSTPARSFYTRPCAGFESSRFASCLADKAAWPKVIGCHPGERIWGRSLRTATHRYTEYAVGDHLRGVQLYRYGNGDLDAAGAERRNLASVVAPAVLGAWRDRLRRAFNASGGS
jgi:arylsulfatase A-like enzyme